MIENCHHTAFLASLSPAFISCSVSQGVLPLYFLFPVNPHLDMKEGMESSRDHGMGHLRYCSQIGLSHNQKWCYCWCLTVSALEGAETLKTLQIHF